MSNLLRLLNVKYNVLGSKNLDSKSFIQDPSLKLTIYLLFGLRLNDNRR